MDESGLKLNNRSTVLAAKRSKNVLSLTSGEKEETIWIIARCNVEEMFLPSFSIFKGCFGSKTNVSARRPMFRLEVPMFRTTRIVVPTFFVIVDTIMYGLPNCTLILLEGPLFAIIEIMDSVRF
ncbi:hypothetical protein Zmor_001820 [Zophobas morio]|uniref:Uncharacterized protein n=1 Tax=Zophobas morio TaxID=2755281 RepID=A0AA38J3F0_9CUCU|nr:hypothetical protein Zmor_001820 [Zophobas morio]